MGKAEKERAAWARWRLEGRERGLRSGSPLSVMTEMSLTMKKIQPWETLRWESEGRWGTIADLHHKLSEGPAGIRA